MRAGYERLPEDVLLVEGRRLATSQEVGAAQLAALLRLEDLAIEQLAATRELLAATTAKGAKPKGG